MWIGCRRCSGNLDKSVRDSEGLSYTKEQKVHANQVEMDEEIREMIEENAR